jgi:zinc transporter 1
MGRYTGKRCRLLSMFSLTFAFFLVEIIVGYVTNSMALVADSFHMLSDIAALFIAFLSVRMAPKSWAKNTFGWARAEVLGALVNAVFLVALCFSITVESLKRFYEIEEVHDPQMILWVGVAGLLVNLLGLCLFHEHGSGHGHSHGGGGENYAKRIVMASC